MQWDIQTFLLANSILALSSILQMATGVSVGMIIVPFLALISYTLIPVPIIFASLTLTIFMAYKGKHNIDTKNSFQISIGMILGIFVSVLFLSNISSVYLGLVFGLFILISVIISIWLKTFKLTNSMNYTGGLIAGIMGTMAAVGGQILALLFQNHKLAEIKATLAFLYTIFSIVMLIIFYILDSFTYTQMISGFYLMPGFILGFLIAPKFSKYFNPKYSKLLILGMATFGAITLIFKSISDIILLN